MARIPGVEFANLQREVINPRLASPALAARGAEARAGESMLGKGLELAGTVGQAYVQMKQEAADREAESKKQAAKAQFIVEEAEFFEEQKLKYKDNPDGFTDNYMEAVNKKFASYKDPDDRLFNAKLDEWFTNYRATSAVNAIGYEAAQKSQVQIDRLNSTIANIKSLAATNPESIKTLEEELAESYGQANRLADIDNVEALLTGDIQEMYANAANNYIVNGDVASASNFIKGHKSKLGERYLTVQSKLNTLIKSKKDEQRELELIRALTQGDELADPSNKDHRKILDKTFQESGALEGIQNLDQDAMLEAVSFVKTTTVIPESLQSTMRGYMYNGTQEQKQYAYQFIASVEQTNRDALSAAGGFKEKEIQDAMVFNDLARAGADTRFALDIIEQSKNPLDDGVRDLRRQELKNIDVDFGKEVLSADKFDENWFWGVGRPDDFLGQKNRDTIAANYKEIYEAAYLRYGNEDAAKAAALNAATRFTGNTYVTGNQSLMEHPPEQHFFVKDLEADTQRKVLQRQLKRQVPDNVDMDTVALVPTINTKRRLEMGLKPTYHAWYQDENGLMELVLGDDNLPKQIKFNAEEMIEEKNRQRQRGRTEAMIERELKVGAQDTYLGQTGIGMITNHVLGKIMANRAALGAIPENDQ